MLRSSEVLRLGRTALVLTLCLCAGACGKNRVSKANYEKVEKGMSLGEVEAILGKGERETGDGSNIAAGAGGVDVNMGEARSSPGTTYLWENKGKKITIVFINDKVFSKAESGL
jgi:hypothetical protein